jgi:hypothetical protein
MTAEDWEAQAELTLECLRGLDEYGRRHYDVAGIRRELVPLMRKIARDMRAREAS